jgi:hypothetical protein
LEANAELNARLAQLWPFGLSVESLYPHVPSKSSEAAFQVC